MHIVAGSGARLVLQAITPEASAGVSLSSALAGILAAAVYVILNHLLTGQAIVLARRMPWRETGILNAENIVSDFVMLCLGQVVAFLYSVNHWLILPALSPVVLMYRALMVPQLRKEAQTDSKTGLLNARQFVRLFGAELARAKRFNRPLSLIMSDLDLLRNINNTYGHLAGDRVLAATGQAIRDTIRKYDVAARFGGEEFIIMMPEAQQEEAEALADRLRRRIEMTDIPVKSSATPIRATISLGVASFPGDATKANDLIHEADVAVYQAKLKGRNCVVCARDVPRSVKVAALFPEGRLDILYAGQFTPRPATAESTHSPETRTQAGTSERETRTEDLTLSRTLTMPASEWPRSQAAAQPKTYAPTPIWLLVTGIIAAGALCAIWGLYSGGRPDLTTLGLLILLAVVAELLEVDVYGESTVSVGVGINFAAALIGGIPAVTCTGAVISLIHYLRRRPPVYKTLFNWGVHILAGSAPVLVFAALATPLEMLNVPVLLVATLVSSLAYFGIESAHIASAVALSQGVSPWATWREHYRWLSSHYVVLCIGGLCLALAHATLGLLGVVVFALPLVMMRHSQKQYVEKTERGVQDLKRMNRKLADANRETVAASRAMQQLNEQLFIMLAKINDARDPFVTGHSMKVTDYAIQVAKEMGLSANRVDLIRQAGFLHDIGKIAISEQVLKKPGTLSYSEYEYVKTHAALGADFLVTCSGLRYLVPVVRHHHERWDGLGYPDGLRGAQIPLEARILAVCDSVEAMASDRPYRRGMPLDEIIAEVQRCAGRQFDPDIAAAFIRVAQTQGQRLVVNSAEQVQDRCAAIEGEAGVRPTWANCPVSSVILSAARDISLGIPWVTQGQQAARQAFETQ